MGSCPVIAVLPNPPSVTMHVSEEVDVQIQRPVHVVGLSLPPPGPHIPVLRLGRLDVCALGAVELRNLIIIGSGADAEKPQGLRDSVVNVASGTCRLVETEVWMAEGKAGFGVVAGCGPTSGCVGYHGAIRDGATSDLEKPS